MVQELHYKTSYTQDKFSIYRDDRLIGKLFKYSWLWKVMLQLDGENYRFFRKGVFRRRLLVVGGDKNKEALAVQISYNLLPFLLKAEANLSDGREYFYRQSGILNPKWEWRDQEGLVMAAMEHYRLLKISGHITQERDITQAELIAIVGIHLHGISLNGNRNFLLSLFILLYTIFRLFLV
jgi:hypothetical protein